MHRNFSRRASGLSPRVHAYEHQNSINSHCDHAPRRCALPQIEAAPQVIPPPDGCYRNYTTAEGCKALQHLGTGAGNTGVDWYSLFSAGDSNFNTGVAAGTLVLNTGNNNTAVGTAALLLNTTGSDNTAVGSSAGSNLISGDGNIYIGAQVHAGGPGEIEFIRIGNDTAFPFPYDTYIAGIFHRGVDMATAAFVFADGTGKLGTVPVDANGNKVAVPSPQVMLDEFLKAQTRVAELESTVERLAATVEEQAAQIQKVSAQLEANKPAPQVVASK